MAADLSAAGRNGPIVAGDPGRPGEPQTRWSSRARSILGIERELARIWSLPNLVTIDSGVEERRIAARTSVMNLVVVARRPEIAERSAAIISMLTGRHPSRILIVASRDPDGPNWLDARIEAHCVMPSADAPETCAEMIHLTAGGAAGRHLNAIVAPLLIHDLPVALWWPGEPPFGTDQANDLIGLADRLIVDASSWSGDGLGRLREMSRLLGRPASGSSTAHGTLVGVDPFAGLAISDFALVRQSRWRESIASVFDVPDLLPYLRYVRQIAVTYGTRDEGALPGSTNLVKPVYHVAWLASRLGMSVRTALRPDAGGGLGAVLGGPHGEVEVVVRPAVSTLPSGTTLRVELSAERRGSTLFAEVTAEVETVNVRCRLDGVDLMTRSFLAPRRRDVDLLTEVIEAGGRDPLAAPTIRFAAALAGEPDASGKPARSGRSR